MRVIVIGCGAAGMMAAISAAMNGASVTVLEGGRKGGRKLLLTGNSRCNMTNMDPELADRYASLESPESLHEYVSSVFSQLSAADTLNLFRSFGLLTVTEHHTYVYPAAGRSDSVLKVLLHQMNSLGIRIKYNELVCGIDKTADGWNVRTGGWFYECDRVIICCGSRSHPSTGSDGSGYELCRGLGLEVTDILPALTGVRCRPVISDVRRYTPSDGALSDRMKKAGSYEELLIKAAGTRTASDVSVYADGKLIARERGQVQFTQTDISGVVIFNMSRFVTRALHLKKDVRITLDLLPDITLKELSSYISDLRKRRPDDSVSELLTGILPAGLIPLFAGNSNPVKTAERIKSFPVQALGLRGFDSCQVCAGGVRLDQLDPASLECRDKNLKGIYIAGELADIDGPCGGYNLQWAWSSGYTAGRHAASD